MRNEILLAAVCLLISAELFGQTTDPQLAPPTTTNQNETQAPPAGAPPPQQVPSQVPPPSANSAPALGEKVLGGPSAGAAVAPPPAGGVPPSAAGAQTATQPQGTESLRPPPKTAQPSADKPDPAKVEESKAVLQGIIEDYRYEPEGKRDPFAPYAAPKGVAECGPLEDCDNDLRRFALDQLTLVGILWDVKTPRAMFVDPLKKTHLVSEQDKIGNNNGYIAEIREGEVVVIEKFYNLGRFTYQTRVKKLQSDEGGPQ